MTIQIIGAGHHRTGTMSLRNALEQLGFPCHHSIDISRPYTENHPEATGAIGRRSANDLGRNFVKAVMTGQPPPLSPDEYFKDFILTTRDMDAWWTSISESILPFDMQRLVKDAEKRNPELQFYVLAAELDKFHRGQTVTKELAIKHHKQHIEHVKATVPADQLLVFDPKDGWEPLCTFLGVPVPDSPYPRVNEAKAIKLWAKGMLEHFQGLLPGVDVYEEYMWPWNKDKLGDFKG